MPFDMRRRRQQIEMDPRFQRATYARQMTDPRQWATPDVGDVVRGYAGRQAEVEEYGAGRTAQIGMREKEAAIPAGLRETELATRTSLREKELTTQAGLREKGLALGEKRLAFAEEMRASQIATSRRDLDYQRSLQAAMKQENRMATYLAIADVGLNVLGGYGDIREAKRQEAFMAEQRTQLRGMSAEQQRYFSEISALMESLITKRILTSRGGY